MKLFKRPLPPLHHVFLFAQAIFIPILLVLSILIFSGRSLQQEVINSNRASVELIRESLDTTFQEMNDLLTLIGENSSMSRQALENTPSTAAKALQDIIDTHPPLRDVILVVRDSDKLYSSRGVSSFSSLGSQQFLKDFLSAGLSENDWLTMAQTATAPFYWSSLSGTSSPYSSSLYIIAPVYYPLQSDSSVASRSATLLVQQSYIQNLFYSSQTASDEGILLLGPDGALLSKLTSQQTDAYVSDVCSYIKENPQIIDEGYTELPGSSILLFVSRSQLTGLHYVRFLPASTAFRAFNTLYTFSIIMTMTAVLIGVLLIRSIIRHSHTPIHSLVDWIQGHQPAPGGIHNELVLFRNALDSAFSQNTSLTQAADATRQTLTDHLLTNLICGNYTSESSFRSACRDLGILLDKPYFAVCSVLIEKDGSDNENISFELVCNIIYSKLPDNIHLQIKNLLFTKKLVLIINSESNDPQNYHTLMTELKDRLLKQASLMVSIGMGSFYDSYDKVGKSYIESVTALDYRLVYGKNCLITPDIYNSSSSVLTVSYPSYDLDLLDSALSSRNTEAAISALHRINNALKLGNYDLHISKYICYEIFSIINKHEYYNDIVNSDTTPLNITNLTDRSAVEYFLTNLLNLLESRLNAPAEPVTPAPSGIGAQLVEYTDAHCLSYDFQIKNMAEYFSISPQYMRKLFRTHTGMSISEYVSNKRIEKSTYLLTQTDMSLQDIVAEIGNSDISGFVRFFKQKTGLTPGQYRKAHKQQS